MTVHGVNELGNTVLVWTTIASIVIGALQGIGFLKHSKAAKAVAVAKDVVTSVREVAEAAVQATEQLAKASGGGPVKKDQAVARAIRDLPEAIRSQVTTAQVEDAVESAVKKMNLALGK